MKLSLMLFIAGMNMYACNNRKQVIIDREPVVYKTTDSLQKIIDLSIFKPDSVAYTYTAMGGADNDSRFPGPKDYNLEAILFYSDSTIDILKGISSTKTIKELQTRDEIEMKYRFFWADKNILKEVGSPEKTIEYSSEKFYKGYLPHGSYIIVGNIVLLKMFTM